MGEIATLSNLCDHTVPGGAAARDRAENGEALAVSRGVVYAGPESFACCHSSNSERHLPRSRS